MSKWVKIVAVAIAIIALIILAYSVLTPEEQTDTTDHMGGGSHMTYTTSDVGLIAFSISAIVIALMVMLLWKEYEPLPPSMVPSPPPPREEPKPEVEKEVEPAPPPAECPPVPPHPTADEAAGRNYLVLRLLTGDERMMFKTIMDSGGEALQKDLILSTKMSNAKVSRLLDRLAQKGVVTKERHGSTNKVKIKPDA
jgi:uncharacterized membrane protein